MFLSQVPSSRIPFLVLFRSQNSCVKSKLLSTASAVWSFCVGYGKAEQSTSQW